jgi:hypothetical protein
MDNYFRAVLAAYAALPSTLLDLWRLPSQVGTMLRAICRRIQLTREGKWPSRPPRCGCCLHLPDVRVRPDPLIYSQPDLMAKGLAVTWDNPDIEVFDGGILVPSHALLPDHDYEVRVRVWNGSYDAAAIGLPVTLSYLSFGIALTSTPVGVTKIDLGAKGTASHPAIASFAWRTPRQAGHYCLQARLDWFDDANPDNNLGQENVQVGVVASPAQFTFAVRNAASVRRAIVFEVDTYELPAMSPCDEEYAGRFSGGQRFPSRLAESRARWVWALETQGHGRFPVPPGWSIDLQPSRLVLDAGAEQDVRVAIEPRDPGFRGTKAFNVQGFAFGTDEATRHSLGGVTLIVNR